MRRALLTLGLLAFAGCLTTERELSASDAGAGGGSAGGGTGGSGTGGGSVGGGTAGGGTAGDGGTLGPQPVETTDVSILYPLPSSGESTDFIRPTESGNFGPLLPQAFFTQVANSHLDTNSASNFAALAVVGLRLDPCSARNHAQTCTPEARLVMQALYDKAASPNDPVAGTAATDGAVHVIYDVPDAELVTMLEEILALRHANGNLTSQTLGPHPILVQQGLDGGFAAGLRTIVLEHLGSDRIARVTRFNHENPEIDAWEFALFDRAADGGLEAAGIPQLMIPAVLVVGSNATGPLAQSEASVETQLVVPDSVANLVGGARPDAGTPAAVFLEPALEAALRVQNPTMHNPENTDCANCHLAEGAVQVAEQVYGFALTGAFFEGRSLAHVDQRTSVTNFHAFGYLGRQTSIMSRTANESALAADRLQAKLP